jgi:dTDP-4-amino-4,6-dideoxygalactose transaminase
MINYGKHFIDNSDISAVLKTLKSKNITQGSQIIEFEKQLSKKFGSKYCSVVSSGTAALHLVGKILNWKKNDLVLCSPITFLATSNSIIYQGARPEFIDIDSKNYNIDINLIEKKLKTTKGRRIKAIIATDFAGHPCDWESLKYLSKKYNVRLINDNCHAIGASYKNNSQYAQKFSDFVIHSYHAVKNITTGEGGAVLTNNKSDKILIDQLRTHGVIRKKNRIFPWEYEMRNLGYNYRITDIQASLGISQLKKLNKFVNFRRKIAGLYDKLFENFDCFQIPNVEKNVRHAYHLYPLLIDFKKIKVNKLFLFKVFKKNNINLQVHYIPIYRQPFYKKKFNLNYKNFPNSENFYKKEISLPIFYNMKKSLVHKVYKIFKNYIY